MKGVQIRQNAAIDFPSYYESLCALHNLCPVVDIRSSSKLGAIDFSADRMRYSDWEPFCSALKLNQTLSSVSVRSGFRPGVKSPMSKLDQLHLGRRVKPPAFVNKELLAKISSALRGCLEQTRNLSTIFIEGIPLRVKDLDQICRGLSKNRNTLTQLSLRHCCFGDEGAELLLRCVKNLPSLTHLDLSGSLISAAGVHEAANLLLHQALHRHSSAWEESLRSRVPRLSSMPGLRRLTLSHNPDIGDAGCLELAEALREDLWVRAVDLQNCGVSEEGACAFQHCLKLNTSLLVVDLRKNRVSESGLQLIHEQLAVNTSTQPYTEFSWRPLEQDPYSGEDAIERIRSGGRRRVRHSGVRGPIQQPPFKAGHPDPGMDGALHKSNSVPHLSTRPHSAGSRKGNDLNHGSTRRRVSRPLSAPRTTSLQSNRESSANIRQTDHSLVSRLRHMSVGPPRSSEPSYAFASTPTYSGRSRPPVPPCAPPHADTATHESDTTGVQVAGKEDETSLLRGKVRELEERVESVNQLREQAELKVVELEIENRTLQRKLEMSTQPKNTAHNDTNMTAGVDESTLEAIEQSLQQFHTFIDILRSKGYGHLLTLLNQEH